MKKSLVISILFLLLAGNIYAQQFNMDTVIERSARAVEEVLPQGAKVAVLNFASTAEAFSDHVIEELTEKLVMGRKITIVDRRNLALISQEMNLQLSGDVSDESAQAIGRMLGAQSIVSGTLTNMGTFYRLRVRVINVETAAIQTQVSFDLRNDSQVAFLLGGSQTSIPSGTTGGTTPAVIVQSQSSADVVTPLTDGIMVPGNNLTEKLAWLDRSADSHNTYIVVVSANEIIAPYTFEYRGAINITVALRGDNQNRTIRLRSNGSMFTIRTNVTFIIENNITIQGHNGNNAAMVNVRGGTLIMNTGARIIGNISSSHNGGGVVITERGIFEMKGGTISGNRASYGAGVDVYYGSGSSFTMSGGIITDNTAINNGGGIGVGRSENFTMIDGIISNNHTKEGGGVYINGGTFNMRGGSITSNIAKNNGGGVFFSGGVFNKAGGIITGYNSDSNNGNVVKDEVGNILARRGHAVFMNENLRRETTAGTGINLSSRDNRWD